VKVGLLSYDEDSQLDMSTVVPMVDGGTEGFKGNARVIIPGISACVECTLDLYPPQVVYTGDRNGYPGTGFNICYPGTS